MGYGIQVTQDDLTRWQNERFVYLEALNKAEKLNPKEDWESERQNKFLRRIAISDLTQSQRLSLVVLLTGEDHNNEDED